jgi:hypothetical protein
VSIATRPIRSERDFAPGERICHIVEADDPDRALCGKDVTDFPWNPPWPFCVVCQDLAGGGGEA